MSYDVAIFSNRNVISVHSSRSRETEAAISLSGFDVMMNAHDSRKTG
jgi:hypothetical protein